MSYCRDVYTYYKTISGCMFLVFGGITIMLIIMLGVFIESNNASTYRESPQRTTLRGSFDLPPRQSAPIYVDENFFSGGVKSMDWAGWYINITIKCTSDVYLQHIRIDDGTNYGCGPTISRWSCYIQNSHLIAIFAPRVRKNYKILIHNNATFYNNITYSCDISTNVFPKKIGLLFIGEFVTLMITIGFLCSMLFFLPGTIQYIYENFFEKHKLSTTDGPRDTETTAILHNQL